MTTTEHTHPAPAPCGSWSTAEHRCRRTTPCSLPADGETVTSGQFRDRVRAGGGRPLRDGHHDRLRRLVATPTRIETVVLSIALARLGAVQNPIIPPLSRT